MHGAQVLEFFLAWHCSLGCILNERRTSPCQQRKLPSAPRPKCSGWGRASVSRPRSAMDTRRERPARLSTPADRKANHTAEKGGKDNAEKHEADQQTGRKHRVYRSAGWPIQRQIQERRWQRFVPDPREEISKRVPSRVDVYHR